MGILSRLFGGKTREDWNERVSLCSRALEMDPSDTRTRGARAFAYEHLEKWDLAISDYSQVIESYQRSARRDPGFVLALVGRARSTSCKASDLIDEYKKSGGTEHKLTFDELAGLSQPSPSAEKSRWVSLNKVLNDLMASAKSDLKEALTLDPSNETAKRLLDRLSR